MSSGRRLQVAAVALFVIAYSLLSHYSNSHAQMQTLATLLALVPMLVLGLVLAWRWLGTLSAVLMAAAVATLLYYDWSRFTDNFPLVYLVQQGGFYGLMGLTFGRSLLGQRMPLCTQFADKVHGPLTTLELRYTRQVTVAWTAFFLANMAVTYALFAFAPLRIWSFFVNFCSLPLIGLMFIGEYAVRRQVLPAVPRGRLLATLRVYFT